MELIFYENALFIKKLKLLAIADLHIGYEQSLESSGYFIPKSQYSKIKNNLIKLIKKFNPEKLLINGDVKHEFGSSLNQEWNETLDLLDTLQEKVEIIIVRGNHDNYLIPILKKRKIKFVNNLLIKNYFFEHGHIEYEIPNKANTIIIAHEHPAIIIPQELGKYKFKCFLKGSYLNKTLIVLPAFSPIMPGTEINQVSRGELLSPILRKTELENFEILIYEEKLYRFKMKDLL
jgi:hypothetical protein